MLVEKTVSQYLFERAMTLNGLAAQIKQVRYINTSDSDIAYAFLADASKPAVVTWKPLVSQIMKAKDVKMVFNSSQIPGEIMDLLVVRTDVLNRPDGSGQKFAKAIAGAWYELMGLMTESGAAADKVLAGIAEASKDSLKFLQRTTEHDAYVLHPAGCHADDGVAGYQENDGPGPTILFLTRTVGGENQVARTKSGFNSQTEPYWVESDRSPITVQPNIHAARGGGKAMNLLRIHASPSRTTAWTLSWFLFAAGVLGYFYIAQQRHQENADDRVMPTAAQMIHAFEDAVLKPAEEDERRRRPVPTFIQPHTLQHVVERHRSDRPAISDQRSRFCFPPCCSGFTWQCFPISERSSCGSFSSSTKLWRFRSSPFCLSRSASTSYRRLC